MFEIEELNYRGQRMTIIHMQTGLLLIEKFRGPESVALKIQPRIGHSMYYTFLNSSSSLYYRSYDNVTSQMIGYGTKYNREPDV